MLLKQIFYQQQNEERLKHYPGLMEKNNLRYLDLKKKQVRNIIALSKSKQKVVGLFTW